MAGDVERDPGGPRVTRELLRALPKTDLHVHLDGSIRPETLLELADRYGRELPATDPDALAEHMHVRDARDLDDYLARFDITLSVLQQPDALERAAYELAADAAAENVRYMEVRYSPVLNTREGLTPTAVIEATLSGLGRAEREYDIRTGVIVCAMRHMEPERSIEMARAAVEFGDRGVVGFDLAGPESGYPPADHAAAFDLAAGAGLSITVHAGEAFGPASIRQAIQECHADRIGHGVRLFEDQALEELVRDRRIPLEVCYTSNLQTRATRAAGEHPVRRYYDAGLVVTINTDNRLMSRTTVTDELWRVHRTHDFSWAELHDLTLMGFRSAFLPEDEKVALTRRAEADLKRLSPG